MLETITYTSSTTSPAINLDYCYRLSGIYFPTFTGATVKFQVANEDNSGAALTWVTVCGATGTDYSVTATDDHWVTIPVDVIPAGVKWLRIVSASTETGLPVLTIAKTPL